MKNESPRHRNGDTGEHEVLPGDSADPQSGSKDQKPRWIRLLIRLFPYDFRSENSREMETFLSEQVENARGSGVHLWRLAWEILQDVARSAPREHFDILKQDLRYGLRGLRTNPGFSLASILTLALGIAANAAIFSIVHAVLLAPLPYEDPERLVVLSTDLPRIDLYDNWLSEPEIADLRERADLFEGFALLFDQLRTLTGQGEAERLAVAVVSANFFEILGVSPTRGRSLTPEDELPSAPPVALISHELWMSRFGGDPTILERQIELDDTPVTIVGVTPAGFRPRFPRSRRVEPILDVWVPHQVLYQEQDRNSHSMTGIGRMKPGVGLAQAQAQLDVIADDLREVYYPKTGIEFRLEGMQESVTGEVRPLLVALMVAVGFVLLITCANVANLLLARNSVRGTEMAVRAALGAHRTRLARQVLTESGLLALLGGLAGVFTAWISLPLLKSLSPVDLPRLETVSINPGVLIFVLGVSTLAALLFSLAPMLQTARQNASLQLTTRNSSSGGQMLRRVLVASEIALVFVLLVGAGLMLQTINNLWEVDPGFDPEGVLTFRVSLPDTKYQREEINPFFDELKQRVAALPGVLSVGAVTQLPLGGGSWSGTDTFYDTTNGNVPNREYFEVDQRVVGTGYFETMRTRLVSGRFFSTEDTRTSRPAIIVDETLAERVWPGIDPVGKRMAPGGDPDDPFFYYVVGVVQHLRNHSMSIEGRPQVYYAQSQRRFRTLSIVARTAGDPSALIPSVRAAAAELDSTLPVYAVQTLEGMVRRSLAPSRFVLDLLGSFAIAGLLLAAVGIFGVVSYGIAVRSKEDAIRLALGACPGMILRRSIVESLGLALAGAFVGILGSLVLARFAESLLFGVEPGNPLTLGVGALVCAGLAVTACLPPAVRARRIDVRQRLES